MQASDKLIVVFALLAAAGTVVGLSLYEAPETIRFDVTYDTMDRTDPAPLDQSIDGSGSAEATWTLERANVTRVAFDVTAASSSTRPQDTTITFTIQPPNATEESVTLTLAAPNADQASDSITFDLADVPEETTVNAANTSAAANATASTFLGVGAWQISVSVTSGGLTGPLEETVRVTATPTFTYFVATARIQTPDVPSEA